MQIVNDDDASDFGMVILPAYYARSLETDDNQLIQYYVDICEGSPASSSGHRIQTRI